MKVLGLLLAGMLVFAAACGDDDDGGVTNIEDADSCEQVADFALNEVQLLLDDLSDMTLEDMGSGEQPESFVRFEEELTKAEEKSQEIGCSDDEMAEHFEDGIDDLEADGPVAELILQGMQSEGDLFEGTTP